MAVLYCGANFASHPLVQLESKMGSVFANADIAFSLLESKKNLGECVFVVAISAIVSVTRMGALKTPPNREIGNHFDHADLPIFYKLTKFELA